MKALAFLILAFPLFSWANLVGVQTIHPAADQTLDFDFGKVPVGEIYYTLFTLSAPADKEIKITEITISGEMYNGVTECGDVLPAGESCDIEVDFAPTSVGQHLGQLSIKTDIANVLVNLKGEGIEPTSN
jgi:hypothetical protein